MIKKEKPAFVVDSDRKADWIKQGTNDVRIGKIAKKWLKKINENLRPSNK